MASVIKHTEGLYRKPVFVLWIAGVNTLYASSIPNGWPVNVHENGSYNKRAAIIPRQDMIISKEVNEATGKVRYQPLRVRLAAFLDPSEQDESDPGNLLARVGFDGCTFATRVLEDIEQDAACPMTIDIGTDLSGLSYPRLVHIGQECFRATSATGGGSPTITFSDRACLGTRQRPHYAGGGQYPTLHSEPGYFRNRPAILYENNLDDNGKVQGVWVERFRGFLDHWPEWDGDEMILSIAALTGIFDKKIGAARLKTNLSQRYHVFANDTGCNVRHVQWGGEGRLYNENAADISNAAGGKVRADVAAHQAVFDTDGAGGIIHVAHPRRGALISDQYHDDRVCVPSGGSAGNAFNVDASLPEHTVQLNAVALKRKWLNAECGEVIEAQLVDTSGGPVAVPWPSYLQVGINLSWSRADYVDYGGAWAKVVFDLAGVGGPELRCSLNSTPHQAVSLKFTDDPTREGLMPSQGGARLQSEGLYSWSSAGRAEPSNGLRVLDGRVLSFAPRGEDPETVHGQEVELPQQRRSRRLPLNRVPRAFYMRGEQYITVESDVHIPDAGLFVRFTLGGAELGQCLIVDSQPVTVDAVTVAYRLELHEDYWRGYLSSEMPTMVEYAGGERITIEAAPNVRANNVGQLCLRLLCSSGGHFLTSTVHDIYPVGAGLTDGSTALADHVGADVDEQSFLAVGNPIQGGVYNPTWAPGDTIGDTVGGLLRAVGYVMDMAPDNTGACRLKAVKLGLTNQAEVVGHIGPDDYSDRSPRQDVELKIHTAFAFPCNYNEEGDSTFRPVVLVDPIFEDDGAERAELEVPLPGLELPTNEEAVTALLPLASRLGAMLSRPRRIWIVEVRAGMLVQMRLGSVYTITHPALKADTGGRTANAAAARVRSVTASLWHNVGRVELVYYGDPGKGWNASCRVDSVPSTKKVHVEANRYSDPQHPITGEAFLDIDGFVGLEGSTVRVVPRGNMAAYVDTELVAVDRRPRTIEFADAHGLTAPHYGYVVPTDQGAAPQLHLAHAYIGDVKVT